MDKYRIIYSGYNEEELKKIWTEAVFVFDNNILLDLYRGSEETRKFILSAMSDLKERLFMPHQIMTEFYVHRIDEIYNSQERFSKLKDQISSLKSELNNSLRLEDNNYFEQEISNLLNKLDEYKKKSVSVENPKSDFILDELVSLYKDNVGEPFTEETYVLVCNDCEERFAKSIPPGYKDSKKPAPEKFGDYFIWVQMINHAKSNKKPIIFVTRDQKEDWITIIKGRKQGPRYELRSEFIEQTGMDFHIYDLNQFITFYSNTIGKDVNDRIVNDLKSLDESHSVERFYKDTITKFVSSKYFSDNKISNQSNNFLMNNLIYDSYSNYQEKEILIEFLIAIESTLDDLIDVNSILNIAFLKTLVDFNTIQIIKNPNYSVISSDERDHIFEYCLKIIPKVDIAIESVFSKTLKITQKEPNYAINLLNEIKEILKQIAKSASTL